MMTTSVGTVRLIGGIHLISLSPPNWRAMELFLLNIADFLPKIKYDFCKIIIYYLNLHCVKIVFSFAIIIVPGLGVVHTHVGSIPQWLSV